jgi:hypothetical protein
MLYARRKSAACRGDFTVGRWVGPRSDLAHKLMTDLSCDCVAQLRVAAKNHHEGSKRKPMHTSADLAERRRCALSLLKAYNSSRRSSLPSARLVIHASLGSGPAWEVSACSDMACKSSTNHDLMNINFPRLRPLAGSIPHESISAESQWR